MSQQKMKELAGSSDKFVFHDKVGKKKKTLSAQVLKFFIEAFQMLDTFIPDSSK